jgi:DNA-binding CsgD family transcriptional regulator
MAQAGAWLERAEELVARHGEDCAERGYLLLPKIRMALARPDLDAARALAKEAGGLGERFNDPDLRALALELEGRALLLLGDVDTALQRYDLAMLTATEAADFDLIRGLVYCSVIAGCQLVYAIDHAREWTTVLDNWVGEQPQLGMFRGTCRVHRAELMQLGGAWNDALAEIQRMSSEPNPGRIDRSGAAYQEAEIHRLRGEYGAAEAAYARVSSDSGDTQPGLALLRLAQGDVAAATGGIRRAVAMATDGLQRARYLPAQVEIMIVAGGLDEARAAAGQLTEIARLCTTPALRAVAAHAQGSVALAAGDAAAALPFLRTACAIWHELDAPYLGARVRAELATACEMLGDIDGVRLERGAATAAFRRLGAQPALQSLQRGTGSGSVLTRREIEVLQLAAAGHTNKQIAATLGLSGRTVDRHVSNILAKLDVPSRAAATAYAYEHGLAGTRHAAG